METTTQIKVPPALQPLMVMGVLLERLEHRPRGASAEQYRDVVSQVQRLLREAPASDTLQDLLKVLPATAQIYENMHYEVAGLCRSPLDAAAATETEARQWLAGVLR